LIGASVKPEMLVLDFVGCVSDLQLCVSVADILADEADEASVVARAKALGASGLDGIAALRQARAEERADKARHETSLALIREEIELRGWVATGGRWDLHDVDPFTRFRSGPPRRETTPVQTTGDARATDKQIKFLVALGWSPERASTLTKRRARCEIGRSLGAGIEPNWCRMREFTRWRATR
jgi:hypothetical protein